MSWNVSIAFQIGGCKGCTDGPDIRCYDQPRAKPLRALQRGSHRCCPCSAYSESPRQPTAADQDIVPSSLPSADITPRMAACGLLWHPLQRIVPVAELPRWRPIPMVVCIHRIRAYCYIHFCCFLRRSRVDAEQRSRKLSGQHYWDQAHGRKRTSSGRLLWARTKCLRHFCLRTYRHFLWTRPLRRRRHYSATAMAISCVRHHHLPDSCPAMALCHQERRRVSGSGLAASAVTTSCVQRGLAGDTEEWHRRLLWLLWQKPKRRSIMCDAVMCSSAKRSWLLLLCYQRGKGRYSESPRRSTDVSQETAPCIPAKDA
ncbi:uncharacterized protein LOC142589859 isoform X3 [Dermacentor variabilis]|uniref:uncharacterized protein LOC142589859 isoform X3 n=1 Tax=Dermacentor variabilis TaxID=34621 RepID=UPI003F5BC6F0